MFGVYTIFDIPYDINSFSINALIYLFTIKFFYAEYNDFCNIMVRQNV